MTPDRNRPPAETWIVIALRGIALTVAAAALLLELSLPIGTIAAAVGTLGATVASAALARSRVRLGAVWLISGLCVVIALLLGALLVEETFAAELLGPHGAMAAADLMRFGLLAVGVTLALRTTSARRPAFAIFELVLIVMALAGVVAAHRDGAINRPRLISDWAWTHGIDPVRILLLIGVGAIAALLLASLHERRGRGWRVILHLALLMLLSATGLLLIKFNGLPQPLRGEGKGDGKGKPDKDDKRGGKGEKGGKGDKDGHADKGQSGKQNQSEDPLPFRNENTSQSTAPVAVVLLHDDYSPPLGYYYFRQQAFSQWNGTRLVATTRDDVDKDIPDAFPTKKTPIPDSPTVGPARTLIHTTVALLADHPRPFGLESPIEYAPKESPDPTRFVRAYDVTSASLSLRYEELLGKKPGIRTWTDEQRAHYTQLPDDPRYKQLADEIIKKKLRPELRDDPFAQAWAISAWLGEESTYSLKSHHADDKDPTGSFLFGDRIGYCVHFAHSAAYLLRARGLPSRMSQGYVADEARRGNGSAILIRQKDAHAWAEVYLDGFGWIIVDVIPQKVLDPPDTPPDPDLQRMLGELARGDKTAGKTSDGKPDTQWLKNITSGLLFAIVWALIGLYGVKGWRRAAPLFAGASSIHRVAYRATLDGLVESGYRREFGETRERFAQRLRDRIPALDPLTRSHVARAYGGARLATVEEMRQLSRLAISEARRAGKWWWSALGFLDPTSWLRSR